jgi:Ca-activated chloride channel family protein
MKTKSKSLVILGTTLAIALCPAPSARAKGSDDATDKTLAPYFVVEGASKQTDAFPLKSTKADVTVSGVIASVTVTQVYENTGSVPFNARYVFPASTRAAVHGMTMRLGDRTIVARIKERQQAKQEFEAAKTAGKTASLLDEERPNVFSMSVANVLPKDRVEVELRYTELLVPTDGVYQFVYPTVVGPRYVGAHPAEPVSLDWVESPYLHEGQDTPATFDIGVTLSGALPIADVRSPSHAVDVKWDKPSLARIRLAKADGRAGNRDFILEYRLAGRAIDAGLMLYEGAPENFFLLMVQPPATVDATAIPPREYIFVLDVSGSMYGFPLDTAKKLIRELIGRLRPTDSFNVILFSGASRLMSPSSLAATTENIDRALAVIDRERGGGGTELQGALEMAVKLPRTTPVSRTVAVITDGFIAEEAGAFKLIHDNLHDTNLFAFGIGSSVNRHLIEGLARAGQGEPFVLTDPSQAAATAARFRHTIESPVLTNVHVEAKGFDTFALEPQAQPDVFAERPVLVFGKWRGPRQGELVVTGRTATGTFSKTIRVADAAPRPENEALVRLWARTRIARLSDFNFDGGDEAVREVTSLGLTYSLLTKHTSFIAVLQEVRNPGGVAKDVKQPLPLPMGVSDLAVGEYGSGAEPEVWLLAALAFALLGARELHRRADRVRS